MRDWKGWAILGLFCALALAPAASGAAAARIPAPIARVQTTHRLVALTLREERPFHAWAQVLDLLKAHGAQATLFVAPHLVRRQTEELRGLMRSGAVEVGLAGAGGGASLRHLPEDAEQVTRILGDQMGLYQPPLHDSEAHPGAGAYRAGLVTVRWSRVMPHDVPEIVRQVQEVQPGEVLRFDLTDARSSAAEMGAMLRALQERSLLVTSAGALIQDSVGHVGYCGAPVSATPATASASPAHARPGRVPIDAVYPSAGTAPRALWHLGGVGERMVRRLYGVKPDVRLGEEQIGGLLESEAKARVAQVAERLYRSPVDATITYPSGSLVPDQPGQRVDAHATLQRIWSAEREAHVEPVIRVVYARWRTSDLASLTTEIGKYRTWIDGSSSRYENIEKGAGRLNNRIVYPGQTFSTLQTIGDVTKEPGWQRAPVIIWGSYAEGRGGGLCQVSSTLYNAVARAKLKIVERHHHAKQVHYVPRGRDATIAWPSLDFRFQNNRTTPIVVRSYVRGGALWAVIVGNAAG